MTRVVISSAVVGAGGVIGLLAVYDHSPYNTGVGLPKKQPVSFSHSYHVSGLRIHCVYCHNSVEVSSFAGMPSTQMCMTCHSQILLDNPLLEPVRTSYRTGKSIEWKRIYDLPRFVFFDHSIHILKGIGCTTCHGAIGRMDVTYKASTLQMDWCLNCHQEPEKYLRPTDAIFSATYRAPANQLELGRRLAGEFHVQKRLDCYTCHR